MDLILLGAPGAGKGTQGAILAERLGIPKIATGDILRDAVRRDTELGRRAKAFMDAGELVPDEIILGLIREVLASPEAADGAILDGFPRTTAQAEAVGELLNRLGRRIDAVIVIEVPGDTIVRRMSGRRTCSNCGRVYNVYTEPPETEGVCDVCGGELMQRSDDQEETVRHRLQVYQSTTQPLVRFYETGGVPIRRIPGDRPIAEVQESILRELDH